MKLVDFSTRRPVSVFISAVAAVVFGMVAFGNLATDLLPDISYPSITVRTSYEGAAPLEIDRHAHTMACYHGRRNRHS